MFVVKVGFVLTGMNCRIYNESFIVIHLLELLVTLMLFLNISLIK